MDYLLKKSTGQLEIVTGQEPFTITPTHGPGDYMIYQLANGGALTVMDQAVLIEAVVTPASQRLHTTQTVAVIDDVAVLRQMVNYSSNNGAISTVELRVNGTAAPDSTVLTEGDTVTLWVQDSGGYSREWVICAQVEFLARWHNEADGTAVLEFNDFVAPDVAAPITLTSEPWASRGSFPVEITQASLQDGVQSVVPPRLSGATAIGQSPDFEPGFFFYVGETLVVTYTLTADDAPISGFEDVPWQVVTTYTHLPALVGSQLRLAEICNGVLVHQSEGLAT